MSCFRLIIILFDSTSPRWFMNSMKYLALDRNLLVFDFLVSNKEKKLCNVCLISMILVGYLNKIRFVFYNIKFKIVNIFDLYSVSKNLGYINDICGHSLGWRYSYKLLAKRGLQLQLQITVLKSLAVTVTSYSILS